MKITDLIEGLPDPLMGQDDPVIVVYNQQGKPTDRLALSVAAKKYRFNAANAKQQFKHQDKVKMGNITLSAPIAGQPTNEENHNENLQFQDRRYRDGNTITDIFYKGKFVGSIGKHQPRDGRPEGYYLIQYRPHSIPSGSGNIHRHERINSRDDAKKLVATHFNEEMDLEEVSQALGHKTAKARHDQASELRQKAVDEPDMMKAFAHTKAANTAEKKAGQSYNRLIKKTNEDNTLEETYDGDDFYAAYGDLWYNDDEQLDEAEYQGRKVKLGKPMRGDVKKFKVYVKNPKGNVVKVNFGDPDMRIKKSNPARRRSFRARHNCDNPGPRHKARFWSCRKW